MGSRHMTNNGENSSDLLHKNQIVTWDWSDEVKKQADKEEILLWDFREKITSIMICISVYASATGHRFKWLLLLVSFVSVATLMEIEKDTYKIERNVL